MKKFAAVLLAGGQSRRMKTDKAFLDYKGMPLWRFQMDKLITLGSNELFFSVPPTVEFPPGPWTFVHDRSADLGPLGGLEAVLRQTHSEFLVTLAVDMPKMTSEFLSFLLERAGPAGVVPQLDGFYHGASAVYPVTILALVEAVLQTHDRSFQHLIREALQFGVMEARDIEPAARALFENWNLPEDVSEVSLRRESHHKATLA